MVEVEIEEADNRLGQGVQAAGRGDLEVTIDFRLERRAKDERLGLSHSTPLFRSAWEKLDHPIFNGQPRNVVEIGQLVRDENEAATCNPSPSNDSPYSSARAIFSAVRAQKFRC